MAKTQSVDIANICSGMLVVHYELGIGKIISIEENKYKVAFLKFFPCVLFSSKSFINGCLRLVDAEKIDYIIKDDAYITING